jgi:hypothetical protein
MAIMDAVAEWYDALDAGDFDRVAACFTPTGTYQDPGTGGPLSGEALERITGSTVGRSRTGSAQW